MRMLVTVAIADAGVKTGTHRVLVIGGCSDMAAPGHIGMSLEEAAFPDPGSVFHPLGGWDCLIPCVNLKAAVHPIGHFLTWRRSNEQESSAGHCRHLAIRRCQELLRHRGGHAEHVCHLSESRSEEHTSELQSP